MTNTTAPFDRSGYERALSTWDRDPASLADSDLDLIEAIDPGMAKKAFEARTRALPSACSWRSKAIAPVPASPAPVAVPPAVQPPAALRLTLDMAKQLCSFTEPKDGQPGTLHTAGNWDALIAQFGTVPVPLVVFDAVLKYILGGVAKRNALEGRTMALEAQITRLEARPTLKYLGSYTGSVPYEAGSIVTHGGSMYHANVSGTSDRPGTSGAWTLCCKAGRDARDQKDGTR